MLSIPITKQNNPDYLQSRIFMKITPLKVHKNKEITQSQHNSNAKVLLSVGEKNTNYHLISH